MVWWAHQDLNLEPTDYESAALTVELWARWVLSPLLGWVRAGAFIRAGSRCGVVSTSWVRYQLDTGGVHWFWTPGGAHFSGSFPQWDGRRVTWCRQVCRSRSGTERGGVPSKKRIIGWRVRRPASFAGRGTRSPHHSLDGASGASAVVHYGPVPRGVGGRVGCRRRCQFAGFFSSWSESR